MEFCSLQPFFIFLIGLGNIYYAASVKSMNQNGHSSFFDSFDSAGFVTIDKPPLDFWLQVISAKLFGYSGYSPGCGRFQTE